MTKPGTHAGLNDGYVTHEIWATRRDELYQSKGEVWKRSQNALRKVSGIRLSDLADFDFPTWRIFLIRLSDVPTGTDANQRSLNCTWGSSSGSTSWPSSYMHSQSDSRGCHTQLPSRLPGCGGGRSSAARAQQDEKNGRSH